MKLSTLLPILAAGAKKQQKEKNQGDRSVERFVASRVTTQCSAQVPSLGGTFDAPNDGFSGAIILNDYPNETECKHVVQADSSCSEIKIQYRSFAVEIDSDCVYDSFRFGWTGTNGFDVTPGRCGCFGDGCFGSFDYVDDYFEDDYMQDYVLQYGMLGLDSFSVDSNAFTFYFSSDRGIANGHVIIDWCCDCDTPTAPAASTTA